MSVNNTVRKHKIVETNPKFENIFFRFFFFFGGGIPESVRFHTGGILKWKICYRPCPIFNKLLVTVYDRGRSLTISNNR